MRPTGIMPWVVKGEATTANPFLPSAVPNKYPYRSLGAQGPTSRLSQIGEP